jgi:hypothetical protein
VFDLGFTGLRGRVEVVALDAMVSGLARQEAGIAGYSACAHLPRINRHLAAIAARQSATTIRVCVAMATAAAAAVGRVHSVELILSERGVEGRSKDVRGCTRTIVPAAGLPACTSECLLR